MALEAGRVIGVLPLVFVTSRLFGRILCSVPFMNYGGPCAESVEASGLLVAAAVEKAKELEAGYLELRCAAPLVTALPVSLRKVSMTIALDPDPDVLWNGFASKHRKNVRRAAKNGLDVRVGGAELLPDYYAILEHSWRDLGTPLYRQDYFAAIMDAFPDGTRIYLCCHEGKPVSVAFVGFHGGRAEGLWQGGLPQARDLDANYVLYWEMIRDICLRGCREFHLGRSTADSGSEWFKSRWNAESRQLYWYFFRPDGGALPALNVDNPRYRLAIAAWRRLPLWVARRLGPPLARCIP
jgi:FemAB-related protein (PEP-CTERM system-associated)